MDIEKPSPQRVLIVSPNFAPINAPDIHRVRMALPYFEDCGWVPTILMVDEKYVPGFVDPMLTESLPTFVEVIKIKAIPQKVGKIFGLGDVALRSLFYYYQAVKTLLSDRHFDLIFFSTSQHNICCLGRYWWKKYQIPFVIDLQDPWRNDFHLQTERYRDSLKHRLSYKLKKYLEAFTLPNAAGLVAVSQPYINDVKSRYPSIKKIPAKTIPFGASLRDLEFAKNTTFSPVYLKESEKIVSVLYMGAVTEHFMPVIQKFFEALLNNNEDFEKYQFSFVGTSYSLEPRASLIADLAKSLELEAYITESPARLPYFQSLSTLMSADVLFVPGATDKDYNASKIYNNVLSGTPIFSIFHENSLVVDEIRENNSGVCVTFDEISSLSEFHIFSAWQQFIEEWKVRKTHSPKPFAHEIANQTKKLCKLFDDSIRISSI
jgi:hypothetical protein